MCIYIDWNSPADPGCGRGVVNTPTPNGQGWLYMPQTPNFLKFLSFSNKMFKKYAQNKREIKKLRKFNVWGIKKIIGPRPLGGARAGCAPPGSACGLHVLGHHRGWHPPPPLRTAYRSILALRTAYRHFLALRTAYRLTSKTTILGVSIYIKKLKLQYVVYTCTVILENISFWCVCLLNFLDFDLRKSMFKFINAEMTPKQRERSERAIFLRVIWLCMSCVLCFWWKLDLFNVKIDVCVRYNRISAYCVPTLCVLRTVYAVFSLIRGAYVVKVIIISITLNAINSFF